MGAVFAIFSGFIFWMEKLLGFFIWSKYLDFFFWTLFWGVNLTFFPMHFLGLSGMPRRIAEYPESFHGWNLIASLGASESTISFFFFLFFFISGTSYLNFINYYMFNFKAVYFNIKTFWFKDSSRNWQITFQDPAVIEMLDLIQLHNQLLGVLFFILLLLAGFFFEIIYYTEYLKKNQRLKKKPIIIDSRSFKDNDKIIKIKLMIPFSNFLENLDYSLKAFFQFCFNIWKNLFITLFYKHVLKLSKVCLKYKHYWYYKKNQMYYNSWFHKSFDIFQFQFLNFMFKQHNLDGIYKEYLIIIPKIILTSNKKNINSDFYYTKDLSLELIWSVIPLIILIFLVGPSLGLLYSSTFEEASKHFKPFISLKIVGSMWYWNYQYPTTFSSIYDLGSFDSYLINKKSPQINFYKSLSIYRNLIVDEILTLPTLKHIRLIITSQDTIHSWTIPSLAVKVDACPGRLNQVYLQIIREGFFFGQCSELCGVNHAFMPINLRALYFEDSLKWS